MRRVPLLFPFFLACFFALFGTALIQEIKLLAFAPFLALLYNRSTFQSSLWVASLCGLIVDLVSSQFCLGLHALNYCMTTVLLYRQRRHFFEDKPLAVCLFTLLISIVSTSVDLLFTALFAGPVPLSGKLLGVELIVMPMLDAVFAYFWFCCPIILYLYIKKLGWKAFFFKLYNYVRLKKNNTERV
jgi:rod shape-determining protein MreD